MPGWYASLSTLNHGPVISNVMQHHRFCSRCNTEMVRYVESDIELDYCADCCEVWFDADELASYCVNNGIPSVRLHFTDTTADSLCPNCGSQLFLAQRGQLMLQMCKSCAGTLISSPTLDSLLPNIEQPESAIGKTVGVVEVLGYIAGVLTFFE